MRDARFDVLRVIGVVAVICIHTFCVLDTADYPQYHIASVVANSFCRFAVPVFVMLSGILLMQQDIRPLSEFYRRRIERIAVPLVTFSLLFGLLRIFRDGDELRRVLWESFLGCPYYHLWFAYMLLGVYLVMPFIARLAKEVRIVYGVPIALLLIYVSFRAGAGPYRIVPFAAYAYLGMVIFNVIEFDSRRTQILLGGGALICWLVCVCAICGIFLDTGSLLVIDYCAPLVCCGTMAFLMAFICLMPAMKETGGWTKLSALVYGVYLVHPIFKGASESIIRRIPGLGTYMWLIFPMTALLSFVAVWVISRCRIGGIVVGTQRIGCE